MKAQLPLGHLRAFRKREHRDAMTREELKDPLTRQLPSSKPTDVRLKASRIKITVLCLLLFSLFVFV